MDMYDTLGAVEAASFLHADVETIHRFARTGELPGAKIGKGWFFLREDLITFLKAKIAEDAQERRQHLESMRARSIAEVVVQRSSRRTQLPVLPTLESNKKK